MMERYVQGEDEKMASLRRSMMKLLDVEHERRVLERLRHFAEVNRDSFEELKALWQKWDRPDITTPAGMRRWCDIYDRHFCLGDYL